MATKRKKTGDAPAKTDVQMLTAEVASRLVDPFETSFMGVVLTNDPLLQEHGGNSEAAYRLYRDLKRDGKVYSGLQKRKLAVIGRPYQVEPISGEEADRADAEVVMRILKGMSFDQLCSDMMDALLMGQVIAEVIWEVQDNLLVPARVVPRAQRRFVYVQDDASRPPQLQLIKRESMVTGVPLPQRKFIVHRVNPEDGNPYGNGLGLQLYWPVYFKRKGVVSWNKLNDRFGSPTPWGKYPNNAKPQEKGTLYDALRAFSQDGFVMTPEGMDLTLLESKITGSISSQQSLCEYMDDWIMEILLGQSPRNSGGGAMAAASVERETVRTELSQADSDLLSETLNASLISWICELNGLAPCMVSRTIKKEEDKLAMSQADKNVFDMGFRMTVDGVRTRYGEYWEEAQAVPVDGEGAADEDTMGKDEAAAGTKYDAGLINAYSMGIDRLSRLGMKVPENFVRDAFNIPTPKKKEKVLTPVEDEAGKKQGAAFAEANLPLTANMDAPTDQLADTLNAATQPVIHAWIDALRAVVDSTDDPQALQDKLLAAFGDLPMDDLQAVMALAFELADLQGRASVEQDDGQ